MLVNNDNRNDANEKERLESLIVDQDEETKVKIFKKYEELLEKLKGYVKNLDITLSEYPVGFTTITDGLISNKDLTVKEEELLLHL